MKRDLNPKVWPMLYAKASTGKIKQWQVSVTDAEDGTAVLWTTHGYIDGKQTAKPKPITAGKNIGKSNATTPREQAISEAESAYKQKLDKKYITEVPTSENVPDIWLPMLAKKYDDHKNKIIFPCMVQPKLNGVRCLARKVSNDHIDFTSRKGKSYNATLGHLLPHLLQIMDIGQFFDGEVYLHGWGFQKIIRRVKKLREDSNRLQYWIYDVADPSMQMWSRAALFQSRVPIVDSPLIPVQTLIARNEDEIEEYHRRFVREGLECSLQI
jgi:DNA ligase-1